MIRTLLSLALIATPAAAFSQDAPRLSLEQRMLVRCSAAFAIVATGQDNDNEDALRYPDMREDGREFFVQSGARLMDETGMSREELRAVFSAEAQAIWDQDTLDDLMPACLPMLDDM